MAYLETGRLTGALEAYFYGFMPTQRWQQLLAVTLWYAFYAILPWAIHHARLSVAAAKAELAPLLPEPGRYRWAFRAISRTLPALLTGLVVEVLFLADYRGRLAHAPGPWSRAYEAVSGPPFARSSGSTPPLSGASTGWAGVR